MGISVQRPRSEMAAGLTVFAILGILTVAVPSIIVLRHILGAPASSPGAWRWVMTVLVTVLVVVVVGFNLYTAARRRRPDRPHVSPIALVGSGLVLAAAFIVPAHPVAGILLMIAFFVDLGGVPWCGLAVLLELRPGRG